MATAYVAAGRPESAIAEGRKYQREKPDRAVGYAIEGNAFVLQKQYPDAAAAFDKALARQPLPALAILRYEALRNAGKAAEATAMADKWFKDRPLGSSAIMRRQLSSRVEPSAVTRPMPVIATRFMRRTWTLA